MKIPYTIANVKLHKLWHKLYIYDHHGTRRNVLDPILEKLSGDWMIKRTTMTWPSQRYAILIESDEDFVLLKMAFPMSEREIKGKADWSRYYPLDRRTSGYSIPSSTREPRPMAE